MIALAYKLFVPVLSGQSGEWVMPLAGWVGLIPVLPLVLRATRAFRPPRLPWPAVPLAHLPVAMIFAAGQVAIMLAIGKLAQRGDAPGSIIGQVRLDVIIYGAMVVALLIVQAARPQA
jgi:hypothetical protein